MIEYIKLVNAPYMDDARKRSGLSLTHTALVILNHLKGKTTQKVINLLEEHHLMYALVPANYTNWLQPLDVSVNQSAKHFMRAKFEGWRKIVVKVKTSSQLNLLMLSGIIIE